MSTPKATSIPVLWPEIDSIGHSSEVAPARTYRVSVKAGILASGKKFTFQPSAKICGDDSGGEVHDVDVHEKLFGRPKMTSRRQFEALRVSKGNTGAIF